MVSGCNILQGCEEEDDQTGVGKEFAFRLKLSPCLNKTFVPSDSDVEGGMIVSGTEEPKGGRFLCLATDSGDALNKWIRAISKCQQTPDKVSSTSAYSRLEELLV